MPALVMATCAFHRWASDRLPPCCLSGTPRHCKGGVYGCSSWQNKNFQVGLLHLDVPWKGLVSTWVLPPCQCVVPGLIILFTWSPLATWVPVEDSGAKQRWSLKLDVSNFLEPPGLDSLTYHGLLSLRHQIPSWVPFISSWSHFASDFWLVPASNASFFQPPSIV